MTVTSIDYMLPPLLPSSFHLMLRLQLLCCRPRRRGKISIDLGKLMSFGSCGAAVGTVLCQKLLDYGMAHHKQRYPDLLQALEGLMATPAPEHLCHEVSHCSIRLSKKGDSAILEVRSYIASEIMPHLHLIRGYLLAIDGELLGPRPVGSLLRRTRA